MIDSLPMMQTVVHASRDIGPRAAAGSLDDESGRRSQCRRIDALALEAMHPVEQMAAAHCPQQLDEMHPVEPTAAVQAGAQEVFGYWDPHGDAESDNQASTGRRGDTVGSLTDEEIEKGDFSVVAARRTEMAQPKNRIVGDRHPHREPAERNMRKDVGNFGIFVGNWGERSETNKKSADFRMLHDSQVMGSPAELIVIFEANSAVADMLKQPPRHVPDEMNGPPRHNAKAPVGNMSKRDHYEHMVVMTHYPHGQIVMAARKNVCVRAQALDCHAWEDGHWNKNGKKKTATTKALVCEFTWKQNIGHLGRNIVVMAVHGHYRTMNMLFPDAVTDQLWQNKYNGIVEHNVNCLVGDWNMSLPQVVPRLRRLGLQIDLCSWYPWLHKTAQQDGYHLGMDSCAMFYIGGAVRCEMPWAFYKIGEILTAAARSPTQGPRSRCEENPLDTYSGLNTPGKLWWQYKNKRNERKSDISLKEKLEGLLQPSTSQDELDRLYRSMPDGQKTAYLRLKQKPTQQEEWLRNPDTGEVHNGAHFPLLMFTKNPSARSKEGDAKRQAKKQSYYARFGTWPMNQTAEGRPASLKQRKVAGDDQEDFVLGSMRSPMNIELSHELAPAVADRSRDARSRGHNSGRSSGWDLDSGWRDQAWDSGRRDWDSGWYPYGW